MFKQRLRKFDVASMHILGIPYSPVQNPTGQGVLNYWTHVYIYTRLWALSKVHHMFAALTVHWHSMYANGGCITRIAVSV